MYIRLLDGSLPKFVTCTSEPPPLAGVGASNVAAVRKPAAMRIEAPVASSERNRRFMSDPFMSKCFGVRNLSKWSKVSERLSFHCTTETAFRQDGILLQWASLELAPAAMRVSIEIRNFSVHGRE